MPEYIIKLTHKDKGYYLTWSTIVDAPVTYGMSLDDFKEYYKEEFGNRGMETLPEILERVEKNGTSSRSDAPVEGLIWPNRAGKYERSLSIDQIIRGYCLHEVNVEDIEGVPFNLAMDACNVIAPDIAMTKTTEELAKIVKNGVAAADETASLTKEKL